MIKSRKLSIFIFSLLLVLASIIFVSCGKLDYSKTYLSSSLGDYIELFVGDEEELSISIKNPVDKMNRGITFSQSNPLAVKVEQIANQNNTTTYSIKGLAGGRTIVDFATIEGRKTFSLTINVKEYSSILERGENGLFVSKSKILSPSSADFKFNDSATERELDFYFYGKTSSFGTLTEEDINSNNGYINNFVSVQMQTIENNDYLIFKDKDGLLYTLGEETLVLGTNNTRYNFIEVTKNEEGFSFDIAKATTVSFGDKFTFMAKYFNSQTEESEGNGNIFCERDFQVLKDITSQDFSHEYGYKIEGVNFVSGNENTLYKIDSLKDGNITLIPQYTTTILDNPFLIGKTANYLTAYLQLEIPSNDLLNFDFNTRDKDFVNTKLLNVLKYDDKTIYYFEVNCSIGNARKTVVDFNFWYDGFENSEDENVNFTYSLPVDIRIIPVTLLINNIDFAQMNKVYKFYDSYASENSGWQAFNFSVVPEGAEFDVLKLDLTGADLQIKYKNIIYSKQVVEIDDIKEPVFVRGGENAELTTEIQNLPVQMDFNIIQPDSLETNIQYEILKGVRNLDFNTEKFKEVVSLERYAGEVLFDDIFADAEFNGLTFSLESGKDVVRFAYDESNIFRREGEKYFLNLNLLPRDVGSGTYLITLDNGISTLLTVEVREGLKSLTLETLNEDNSVKLKNDTENNSLIYLLYRNSQVYFDAKLIANGDVNSTAIIDIDIINDSSSVLTRLQEDGRYFIYSTLSGQNQLTFKVRGYKIDNFVKDEIYIEYIVDLVTYELAQDLFVYKLSDAFNPNYEARTRASYVNVYAGTNNNDIKQAKFEVVLKNPNAFLFQSQSHSEATRTFVAERFMQQFVYFESDTAIFKDGKNVDRIFYSPYQNNIYTIGNVGTFDAERMIFTAMGSGEVKLIAHVMQYNKLYSETINIKIHKYEEVQRVTLLETLKELEFSAFKQERSVIAYPTNSTATSSELAVLVEGGQITRGGQIFKVLNKNSITFIESDGKTHITFKVDEDFLKKVVEKEENYDSEVITGKIKIVAKDWLDSNGDLRPGYNEYVSIDFSFAKGTENSRYTIESSDDLAMLKDNLSAHFKIKTAIDASSITKSLGELTGSIIGEGEYAEISGIGSHIDVDGQYYFGLFTKISSGAYIKNVQFSGSFQIISDKASYIGLVAGINEGTLTNVGASIFASKIMITSDVNVLFGGLVGENKGTIVQDFTALEKNATPKVVMMNDVVDIKYTIHENSTFVFEKNFGGIAGVNNGTIQKIDGTTQFNGYANYMVYSKIKTSFIEKPDSRTDYQIFVGGLVGKNTAEAKVLGGYKDEDGKFGFYTNNSKNEFKAGKGLIVGGEVWGHGFTGGVAGINENDNLHDFTGITTRTFVRAYKPFGDNSQISLISYLNADFSSNEEHYDENKAYAIQAVDDGKILEESAMAVLYDGKFSDEDKKKYETENGLSYNALGFGTKNGANVSSLTENNVLSYLNRHYLEKTETENNFIVSDSNRANYYGEFIVVGQNQLQQNILLYQKQFAKGSADDLSIGENFNNALLSENGKSQVFYTYYFNIASVIDGDIAELQNDIDLDLNRHTSLSEFYPIVAKGEMTFISKSPDILTFDQMGKVTIKGTGLALVTASSILNSNESLNFYIYVVNYFNSQALEDDNNKISVIYPTPTSSDPINQSTITLRGNNSAMLYVIPDYQAEIAIDKYNFISDSRGFASYGNVSFYLAQNTDLTASVRVFDDRNTSSVLYKTKSDSENYEQNQKFYDESENPLDISVVGQIITIRRKDNSLEGDYRLQIKPILKQVIDGNIYTTSTNKTLEEAVVDYKFGAISLNNKNYNGVSIVTSGKIYDEITIISTDEKEDLPKYYMLGLNDKPLQGDIINDKINYEISNKAEFLFILKFNKISTQPTSNSSTNGTFKHIFSLEITINTNCELYQERYIKDIYGSYLLHLESSSNSTVSRNIEINFEKTGVQSIVIDNYTNLNDNQDGLTSTSDLAYPGEAGLLVLTVKPSDSDFDYILIENDEQNLANNRAIALFSLLARNDLSTDSELNKNNPMFDDNIIAGSIVGNGFKITLNDLIAIYARKGYKNYDGVIYIKYNLSSSGVSDLSKSKINVSVWKDGNSYYSSSKELTVKLQNYVAVEVDGKEPVSTNQNGIYHTYEVARGLKYKLNINSYGFRQDSISITSDNSICKVTFENGNYYLNISESAIDFNGNKNEIILTTKATQKDGETVRTAESKTKIVVFEYVLNYNNNFDKNSDIVKGMSNGVINVQVGTKSTLGLDIYDYIEYNPSISGVKNKIEEFISSLEKEGRWETITNLISDDQPDYKMADPTNEDRKRYLLGYNSVENRQHDNYYFTSDGLSLIPKRTHQPVEKFYYIDYCAYFDSENGVYVVKDEGAEDTARKIETTFVFSVYSSSSEESPIPIYTYSDLTNMQSGGYYILLNDITLPSTSEESGASAFTPLNGDFASFDGNGHAINFAGIYDMGALTDIGLFHTLNAGSIIKNLIVNYTTLNNGSDLNTDINDSVYGWYGLKTVKFITTAENFVFGSIVAQNMGIITNCRVYSDVLSEDKYYLAVKADNAITNNSYVGGLCGYNSGYITNSGVSINAKVPFNLAGLVAQNNGKIAGCYFEKGILINNSQYDQHIGGLAITNSKDAQIITSYVSGKQINTNLFSKDSQSEISSTLAGAGFVYNNAGTIKDCYTDINLSKTSSDMAGFVYRNGGTIRNSFSLSILRNNTTASAGFVKENSFDGGNGQFENCYYLYNLQAPSNDQDRIEQLRKEGHYVTGENNIDINVSLYDVTIEGVQRLTQGQFADIEKYFNSYSYDENVSARSVWFFSQGYQSEYFVDYIPTTEKIVLPGDEGNNQSNTVYNRELMMFGKNRLSLVAPNTRVLSLRNFDRSEIDEATEEITYFYTDDMSAPERGSLHNPRLIYDAQSMENEILNQTASNNINTTDYRMISNVNYVDFKGHSNLYKVIYAGNFEGNGMEISSIGLVYMNTRTNGGLFSQIGYSASKTGSVKNLKISPKEVIFNNTNNVGTLAGTLRHGYIYDITVDAYSNNLSAVSGLNFVGGIIGKADTAFEAKDIYSDADIWSVYTPVVDEQYIENVSQENRHSYAGGLIGFVGKGKVQNAHVKKITSVTGSKAGILFGGIGNGANVDYAFADVTKGMKIRSNFYAGYIVGENSGNLNHAYVSNNGSTEFSFVGSPKVPMAVGGIAGKFCGGKISNVLNEQSFELYNEQNQTIVENVGGLIGYVHASDGRISMLEDSVINADITGTVNVGGAVGTVNSALVIDGVAVKSDKLTVKGRQEKPKLGGVVGYVRDELYSSLEMKNSYCISNLYIDTHTMGIGSAAQAGGLIGYSTKEPVLSYCYTTSIIDARVYDIKALGTNKEFDEIEINSSNNGLFEYVHKVVNNDSYNNVYYLGAGKVKDGSGNKSFTESDNPKFTNPEEMNDEIWKLENYQVYKANNEYAKFYSRAKNNLMNFTLNNYGVSAMEYVNKLSQEVSGVSADRLRNLYGNIYQIKDDFDYKGREVSGDDGNTWNLLDSEPNPLPTNELMVGTELYYNTSKDWFTNGNIKIVRNNNETEQYVYYQKAEPDEDASEEEKKKDYRDKWSMTITENLQQIILYKGSDRESYRNVVNVEGEGDRQIVTFGYERIKDGIFIAKVDFDNMNIYLNEVWKTSFNSLSTLYIEDNFKWINMT